MAKVSLDITKDLAPHYQVTVKIKGMRKWLIRKWVAIQILKLVALIMNVKIVFEKQPWYGTDL